MKKLICGLLLSIIFLTSIPVCTNAAPRGYKVVKLTKKNIKKYLALKKYKDKDVFGDYNGYHFTLYSKMRKKGYYVYDEYDVLKFAVKYTLKERYKIKIGKRWRKNSSKWKGIIDGFDAYSIISQGSNCNYKYGKITNLKFKKVKGSLIFVEPSNVMGIKKDPDYDDMYDIMLRYPYNSKTPSHKHWDSEKDKWVVDYYYLRRSRDELNRF